MHISDGVLPTPVIVSGFVVTGVWVAVSARKLDADDMPRVAVMSAAFFVASLIHVQTGMTSVHLLLHGLVGIVLGTQAMLAILMGLTLQALLLQHGGVSTIGINTCIMGIPAVLVGWGYRSLGTHRTVRFRVLLASALTAVAVILSAVVASLALLSAGSDFETVVGIFLVSHIPIIVIEAFVTGGAVSFLLKVKPEILLCSSREPSPPVPSATAPK